MNENIKDKWTIDKNKFDFPSLTNVQRLEVQKNAFALFYEAIKPWKANNKYLNVALGGDSDCGEWSLVYENDLWIVFIGERGLRFSPSFFTSIWDALNFIGFNITSNESLQLVYKPIYPKLNLI